MEHFHQGRTTICQKMKGRKTVKGYFAFQISAFLRRAARGALRAAEEVKMKGGYEDKRGDREGQREGERFSGGRLGMPHVSYLGADFMPPRIIFV